jgi:ATP-binding cassette subfamily B protein
MKKDEHIEEDRELLPGEVLKGSIRFEDLSFSYPSRPETEVLSNINLQIKSDKLIAIVGPSGGVKLHWSPC